MKEAAAVWEVKTDGVIQRNQAKRRLDELRAFRARTLDDRRSKLALKLQQDDAALQRELETTKESPEVTRSACFTHNKMYRRKCSTFYRNGKSTATQ